MAKVGIFPPNVFVEGVDLEAAAIRYPGNTYREVLRSYCLHTPLLLEKMRIRESIEEYVTTVHGLKGSSFGICADAIAHEAAALEAAACSGDMGYIEAQNAPFIAVVEKLLVQLNELVASLSEAPEKKIPASCPNPALLAQLLDACKHYRANVMEELIAKLEAYQYDSGGELIPWLREQLDNLEYDAIRERLESGD